MKAAFVALLDGVLWLFCVQGYHMVSTLSWGRDWGYYARITRVKSGETGDRHVKI